MCIQSISQLVEDYISKTNNSIDEIEQLIEIAQSFGVRHDTTNTLNTLKSILLDNKQLLELFTKNI